ncbi:hypothetical protein ABT330_06565 [Streptomyces sp. NPDC000658]|uniref:hypothetical protein n=1 Tax=Streptomyces sp. NPDC000658 TaxID=3154266 RepID=UPI00331CD7A1
MATQTQAVLDATEITQAVQDLDHSVTLIARKTTVVRLYVSGTSGPAAQVRGVIAVSRSDAGPAGTVESVNAITLDPAHSPDLATRRGNADLSLNFILPAGLTTEGESTISAVRVVDAVSGTQLPLTGPAGLTVRFQAGPPLHVRILGIRYEYGTPPTVRAPRDLDYRALISWLTRAYPVPEVISTRAVVDASAPPDFTSDDVNAQLAALRALDMSAGGDQHTHYYGMVADSGFFMRGAAAGIPATVASGPTGPATFGWDFDGVYGDWYGGHELGHTFGRKHPGFCSESADDLLHYPFPNGQLGDASHEFMGFDVGDPAVGLPMRAMPGQQWHDVMTYCDRQWISSYTYEGIRQRLLAEDALMAGAGPAAEPAPAPVPESPRAGARSAVPGGRGGRPDDRYPTRRATVVTAPRATSDAAAGPGPDGPAEQYVSVVGMVNLTQGKGGIRYVNPVEPHAASPSDAASAGAAPDGAEAPTAVLRIVQSGGAAPKEITVPVKLSSEPDPGADRTGLIDAVAPAGATPAAIELVLGGHVVDTFRPAGPPPALRTARHTGTEGGALGMALEFDASPDPGQTYSAQVSSDGGRTWHTVGVGLKDPTVHLDRNLFRHSTDVRLRITTTNGFSSTTAETSVAG